MDQAAEFTPLVLLVDDQEWTSRSIESILRPKGHVVLKAYTGQQALDLLTKVSPDAILVDIELPDIEGQDLVRHLRESPTVQATTPIVVIAGSAIGRARRLDALGAGAWDILVHPVDPNELILRLDTFVRAKQEADRVRDEGLTDISTGLYNVRGVLRRAKEIGADSLRAGRPLTCIAFGRGQPSETDRLPVDDRDEAVDRSLSKVLLEVTRLSDTIGRLGPGEFVVIAPGTDRQGALRLADRVLTASDQAIPETGGLGREGRVRVGVADVTGKEPIAAEDLLLRATMALRKAQSEDGSFPVRAYDA